MIRISRGQAPKILVDPKGAKSERDKAARFYADPANAGKTYKFKIYSHDQVKEALTRLFGAKCAYCESRYAGTQPMDVEHFRPKGKVLEDDGTEVRGYYWLASEWTNLLPSCIDCNRERRQWLADIGTVRSVGKGERFPLEKGCKRAAAPDEEKAERPLLLNPCLEDPEKHFEFTEDAIVRPSRGAGAVKERAQASIEVYALNRSGLVEERLQLLRLLQRRAGMIESLMTIVDREDVPETIRTLVEDLITHEMDELRKTCEPGRPFSLMARQFIDDFRERLRQ
ncbi:MAG TPA: retron system putative HNH endonuclease [Thermoanaerobaculia bacterium]|nr:retron system putative HNH endonuclease [Thermoanaerobaculia bacterium]